MGWLFVVRNINILYIFKKSANLGTLVGISSFRHTFLQTSDLVNSFAQPEATKQSFVVQTRFFVLTNVGLSKLTILSYSRVIQTYLQDYLKIVLWAFELLSSNISVSILSFCLLRLGGRSIFIFGFQKFCSSLLQIETSSLETVKIKLSQLFGSSVGLTDL